MIRCISALSKTRAGPALSMASTESGRMEELRVKMACDRRPQIRILFISLAGILCCAFIAGAGQGPYDLDLKELRRPPLRRAKGQKPSHVPKKFVPAASSVQGENSIYTVRPGDHLFLILMQRYGLSNNAAEQLIPEIMRLNGVLKPEGLSVGQRLTIPLLPITDAAANKSSQSGQAPHPSPLPESGAAPPHATETHLVQEIVADRSRPCMLARDVAEQLGIRISPLSPFLDAESVSVAYDALKVAVVCGLEPAEAYTLERLLTRYGVKLLLFKADEAPRTVIEGLAGRLGIFFRLSNADAVSELPLTYLFPAAISGKDLRLTILPDPSSSK